MLSKIKNYLIAGLIVLAPLSITLYILWKVFFFLDGILGQYFEDIWGVRIYGLGLIVSLLVILVVGILATNFAGKQAIGLLEQVLVKIPIVSGLYDAMRQLSNIFLSNHSTVFRKVVLIKTKEDIYPIGFLVSHIEKISDDIKQDMVVVFVPTAPNPTTGFILLVPKEKIITLNLSIEEGIKIIISGGTIISKFNNKSKIPI